MKIAQKIQRLEQDLASVKSAEREAWSEFQAQDLRIAPLRARWAELRETSERIQQQINALREISDLDAFLIDTSGLLDNKSIP